MEILRDRSTKAYSHLSRYASFPFYYHTLDNKYIYGLTSQLSQNSSYVLVDITMDTTLEILAAKYYGRPDYYWIIADYNQIQDPFLPLYPKYQQLKIPSISSIEFVR